ncbi:Os02g0469000 [Oryza sativa Japonica Group]|jgi:hypothetical protein|uniref:Os02g0469000 protein n=5 Tax=Oryza TaxID=4527 RepID=A0A0P0VIU7_ORYSJ|nr:uncharacterized protein LOC4329336 [Oryza sativa Japonica Group]KAB8087237.1 hypothetical protein EE612_011243 [Oryza sativa]EAZ22984.1 hypothetical protein OsJ_06678 [Oryza sativa Japonica Group]KAF2944748.1 hypothetical protein DAI22_02g165600 [Oryza sativa Japonica Group]BAD19373.1 hypothetical protein [Oryza sativa Japonica Group]BAS78608.1 Os02g0469000 [Oryza sativa Japonica Group]
MTSEDGDISALLSEPSIPEEQPEASEFDDVVPAILESIKSSEKAFKPSPEEAAWADSCFVQTSELSDSDWGAMKHALLNALEKPTEIPNNTSEIVHEEGSHAILEVKPHSLPAEIVSQHDDMQMEQKENNDYDTGTTEASEVANVIRGTNEHGKQMDGYTARPEDGDELSSSEVLEQTESRETIFKVWDLDVPFSDEDELELIKDLKKLLKDNPQESEFRPPSGTAKTLSQIAVDDLVADLSDLSLQQTDE